MDETNVELLFNRQSFADQVTGRLQTIRKEVGTYNPRYDRSEFKTAKDRDMFRSEATVAIPSIVSKQARVKKSMIEYTISFEGADGAFFKFKPSNPPRVEQPVGVAYASGIAMHVPNEGDAQEIKAELQKKYDAFSAWYEALSVEVEAFNDSLPAQIGAIFAEHEEKEGEDRKLEDELNS